MLQQSRRALAFRSATPAAPALPLRVRSAGRYELWDDWEDVPRQKWFVELFWGSSGVGEFRVGKDWLVLEPEHVFFYWPGDTHQIRPRSDSWRYCWATFDHDDALRWVHGFGLTERVHRVGPCPESLFWDMLESLRRTDAAGEVRAANLGHQLLTSVAVPAREAKPDSLPGRAKAIIDAQFADPAFGVESLADELAVHRSTLFRQFNAAHGLSPSAYLQNLRLQRGVAKLRETNASVQEVALEAGFTDANYFARAIRQITGMSPRELRRS